jgi:phospholipid-transporting ATPase
MVRNAILVQYSFYKNLVLTWTIILYTYNNGFSGQTLFNSWVLQCFNVVFTSLPPLIMGIFERDLCDDVIEQDPLLLVDVSRGQDFSIRTASLWLLASIYHGFLIYWLMVATFPQDDSLNGRTSDLWTQGSFMVSCVITCVLAKNALVTRTWTWIQLTALLLSYLSYFLFLISWTLIDPEITADWDFYWVAIVMLSDVKFWLWTLMFGVGVLAPDFALMYLKRELKPAYRDITQVRYKEAKVDHALGSNSRI